MDYKEGRGDYYLAAGLREAREAREAQVTFPSSTGYYKVLAADLLPFHGGRGAWQVGVERSVRGKLVPCENGVHAATLEQLLLWLGPAIHPVVAVSDERVNGGNKWVFRSLTIGEAYQTWNARSQRHFACDCAERALREAKRLYGWQDERCEHAVRVARQYADGLADDAALRAARAAAEAAARAAAREEETVEASGAAWTTTTAAWTTAAWAAAREAAQEAAQAAWEAEVAERAWQAERLALYLSGELPPGRAEK